MYNAQDSFSFNEGFVFNMDLFLSMLYGYAEPIAIQINKDDWKPRSPKDVVIGYIYKDEFVYVGQGEEFYIPVPD